MARDADRVAKVVFESLPGFFDHGALYRPSGDRRFRRSPLGTGTGPAAVRECGAHVRTRTCDRSRAPGFVVFSYDIIGYNDSEQLPHTFGGGRESLWGGLAGLQLWNSMRRSTFSKRCPTCAAMRSPRRASRAACTQTFLLRGRSAREGRGAYNMISQHMQEGCLCEDPPASGSARRTSRLRRPLRGARC